MYQFSEPCLESALRLDVSEVTITGQAQICEGDREVLVFETRLVEPQCWCGVCGVRVGRVVHGLGFLLIVQTGHAR